MRFEHEQGHADGLVLTEWKKAASKGQAEGKFKEARDQAHRYGRGVLVGNELTNYRFAIVVLKSIPDDISYEGIDIPH